MSLHNKKHIGWLVLLNFATIIIISGCENMDYSSKTQLPLPSSNISPTSQLLDTPTIHSSDFLTYTQLRQRWLSGTDCFSPCWEGIEPGVTTAIEAQGLLENNSLISNIEMGHYLAIGFISFDINFTSDDGLAMSWSSEVYYDYSSDDKTITGISGSFPSSSLGEVVQVYGSPDYAVSFFDEFSSSDLWTVRIIWSDRGLQLWASGQGEPPKVDESLALEYADYFQPGLEGYRILFGQDWVDMLTPWQGYSDFSVYQFQEPYLFPDELTSTP